MRKKNLRVALIGKDGRTSAIERCLNTSSRLEETPRTISEWKDVSPMNATREVLNRVKEYRPDFLIVGPEEPLAEGIVDLLNGEGIPCIGPTKSLARLESSKAFTRKLLSKYNIQGNPEFKIIQSVHGIEDYLKRLGEFVIKPDGLTGGKGVKVSGAHLHSIHEAVDYCSELLNRNPGLPVVIEEKLDGEEFSLQSFCSGTQVKHMAVVQDHKRAGEGDTGPNTGGMGSYSDENLSLPFLTPTDVAIAGQINEAVAKALFDETGQKYRGILYGGFMLTRNGIRVLEFNARFGDPEALNVLSILKTDLVDICEAIIEEKLDELTIEFEKKATVCKYVVPEGYPEQRIKEVSIDISRMPRESEKLRIYRAAVREKAGKLIMTGSRAIACVGIGKDLDEAQTIAEEAACSVKGPVFHRRDIGTYDLIQQRVQHVRALQDGLHVVH